MSNGYISLFQQNPWLLYLVVVVALIAIAILISIVVNSVKSGIPVDIFGIKIGNSKEQKARVQSVIQNPAITQSQTTNIYPSTTLVLSEEQVERIAEKAYQIKRETNSQLLSKYLSPKLSENTSYLHSIVLDTRNRLAKIVLGVGGGWAGCSIAPVEVFIEYSKQFIGEDLFQEINDLITMISIFAYHEDSISDEDLLKIQFLNAHININLEKVFFKLKEEGKLIFE